MEQPTRALACTLTHGYVPVLSEDGYKRTAKRTPVILRSYFGPVEASNEDRYAKTMSTTQSYLAV